MRLRRTLFGALVIALGVAIVVPFHAANAAEEKPLPRKKEKAKDVTPGAKSGAKAPALNLDLPAFSSIPTGESLKPPPSEPDITTSKVTPSAAEYKVLDVVHAKGFMRGPQGSQPMGGALKTISTTGSPPTSERFTTVVRVRCKQRVSAPIEVAIVSPRGGTFMSGRGEVSFRGVKKDEVDYTIDWDPTPAPEGGDYEVQVRIAGQSMGGWPIKIATAQ